MTDKQERERKFDREVVKECSLRIEELEKLISHYESLAERYKAQKQCIEAAIDAFLR